MARVTGLEPATPGVTGRYSNQLSYTRACPIVSGRAEIRTVRRTVNRRDAIAPHNVEWLGMHDRSWQMRHRRVSKPAHGRLAQMVEHLVYTEVVGGSIPSPPTTTSGAPP